MHRRHPIRFLGEGEEDTVRRGHRGDQVPRCLGRLPPRAFFGRKLPHLLLRRTHTLLDRLRLSCLMPHLHTKFAHHRQPPSLLRLSEAQDLRLPRNVSVMLSTKLS